MSNGNPFHDTVPAGLAGQTDGMPSRGEPDAAWLGMLHQLVLYQIQNGHCRVPTRDRRHPRLAAWLEEQTTLFRKGMLAKDKQRELESLGMEWDAREERTASRNRTNARWQARFREIEAFKERHGHLRMKMRNQSSAGLKHWLDNQRIRFRNGVMTPRQKARLDGLGFEWEQPGRLSPSMEEHNVELWESMYARLLAFRKTHGHCQVPNSSTADRVLAKWVQRQRDHYRKKTLHPGRRQLLEKIGFAWMSDRLHFASGWEGRFAEIEAFKEKHGHLRITMKNQSSAGLAHWRDNQRIRFRNGVMTPEQKARLDALGFEWEPQGRQSHAVNEHHLLHWDHMYAWLVAFKEEQGHSHVTKRWQEHAPLAGWLKKQRIKFRKGSGVGGLPPEQLARLDALGTEWRESPPPQARLKPATAVPQDPRVKWEQRHARLVEFHRLNGHANVPGNPDRLLRKWVLEQRARHAEGSLEPDQVARLEELGFSWETPKPRPPAPRALNEQGKSIWDLRFEEMCAFVTAHGHFRVPKNNDELKKLHHWVVAQRVYRRRGTLSAERLEKLESLAFPWDPGLDKQSGNQELASRWNGHFRDLTAFKEHHGHTRVPHHRGPDKKLGGWLVRQRRLRRLGRLSQDRFQQLESLGVDWKLPTGVTHHGSSEKRMNELRAFHALHGHTDVPTKYPPNKLLGNWVSNTRISYKKGQLDAGRVQELEALGFRWQGERNSAAKTAATWERSFAELRKYHEAHGHVKVRSTDTDHPELASWVKSQRAKHRQGTLRADRARKLEAVGFHWGKAVYQPGLAKTWDQRFADLVAFRRQYGHPHVSKADKAHHSLDIWAKTQRVWYHQGKLTADQIQRLESIGFKWNGNESWWERQFRRWEAATQRRRTRHLTAIGDVDDDLAKWEQTQRNLHRQGKLGAEKARLLARAGLIF